MKFLEKLTKNEVKFQRIIGLGIQQLDLLVQAIEPLWNKAKKERLDRANRKRKIGGGHPYKLSTTKEKIVAVLLYYRQYPTQEVLGYMLGIDQSAVSRLLKKMLPLIEKAADPQLKTYLAQAKEDCQKRIGSWQDFLEQCPDLKSVATDVTEQAIFRSVNYEQQKKHFSGKTKQHAIKTQISVSQGGCILDVSESYPGSTHDKTMLDQEKTIEKIDPKIVQRFDSGYQGIKKEHPDHYLVLPVKKSKNKELTSLDKEHNKYNSKRRIIVEHAFAKIKKFRICGGLFRQALNIYNQTFRNIAAIINFRLQHVALGC